jgi:Sec-independent protein translocase protein TatA
MLSQAASRFADVLEGLKRMTSDMQQELEATRSELRKGILELPQETADTAAQMRRVIVDQIEALAELNRIVARHGRGIDVVEPAARRVEAVEAGPPRRPMPREMAREAPREAARELPREEPPLTNGGPRPEPARPRADITGMTAPVMPARRAEAPALSPTQQAGAGGGRTGWLSDLLTRASQEAEQQPVVARGPAQARESVPAREPAPPPQEGRHSIDSLDSLAVDIARMIDHDAAAELWDRYKRGERNVFTRQLYTMQGQKAFEEIRRKYRGDRDFMRTVDRYIGEFERLLEEVSRDDRGQVVARTYLTSETGKVYTMLAHAAGRFD